MAGLQEFVFVPEVLTFVVVCDFVLQARVFGSEPCDFSHVTGSWRETDSHLAGLAVRTDRRVVKEGLSKLINLLGDGSRDFVASDLHFLSTMRLLTRVGSVNPGRLRTEVALRGSEVFPRFLDATGPRLAHAWLCPIWAQHVRVGLPGLVTPWALGPT